MLASVIEAVIGACFLTFGYERTADAVVGGVRERALDDALERPVDFKSAQAIQERAEPVGGGAVVSYEVVARVRHSAARPDVQQDRRHNWKGTRSAGRGSGRSKKDAEQLAAQVALDAMSTGTNLLTREPRRSSRES